MPKMGWATGSKTLQGGRHRKAGLGEFGATREF